MDTSNPVVICFQPSSHTDDLGKTREVTKSKVKNLGKGLDVMEVRSDRHGKEIRESEGRE